jgi:hypothetical protein
MLPFELNLVTMTMQAAIPTKCQNITLRSAIIPPVTCLYETGHSSQCFKNLTAKSHSTPADCSPYANQIPRRPYPSITISVSEVVLYFHVFRIKIFFSLPCVLHATAFSLPCNTTLRLSRCYQQSQRARHEHVSNNRQNYPT